MKKILNWLGLYTKKQYVSEMLRLEAHRLKTVKEKKDIQLKGNSNEFLIKELKKSLSTLPFEFDTLILKYKKEQINAFVYKMINHARNTPEMRDLLDIWQTRIINAKETIKPNDNTKKEAIDYK